jgi:predicted metal-dependent hydrolase
MIYELTDEKLGKIIIKPHVRAKRIIARQKNGHIELTVPQSVRRRFILSTIERMKPQLLNLLEAKKNKRTAVNENDIIHTHTFTTHIGRHSISDQIGLSLKNEKLLISFPQNSDISTPESQNAIRKAVAWGLRIEAKRILSEKTAYFAQKFNLLYNGVKITSSKGRWGSCSGRKNINYSLYLLLLPEKFIDYVVLHELAHTVEMNHSEHFWALLDTFTNHQSRVLAKELKAYKSEWGDFLT